MKNKINRFYADNFDDKKLEIILPRTKIFFKVRLGGKYTGNFIIKSKDNRRIRGMIYTSSFRMQCRESGFDGTDVKVSFTFDAVGLPAGDIVRGKFDIVSEAGEYEIQFTASVEVPYIQTSVERITNLEDFVSLSAYGFREALGLFETVQFRELINGEDDTIINLYEGIRKVSINEHSLEEFLVAIGKKDQLELTFSEYEKKYDQPDRNITDILEIGKNTWGYMDIQVEVEGTFIRVDRKQFSTLEFTGNRFELEYMIRKDRLHDGINRGHICLKTPYDTMYYVITVDNARISEEARKARRAGQVNMISLLREYIQYKMGKVSREDWMEISEYLVKQLEPSDDTRLDHVFIKAYMALEENNKEEALRILDVLSQKRWSKSREAGEWACYAYLISKANQDLAYTMKVVEEIRKLRDRNTADWLLLWVLLQMEEYLIQNTERRIQVMEEQWLTHNFHSLLYLEAFLTIREQPGLIDLNNPFIVRTLLFAKRRKVLTREVASSVALNVSRYKSFNAIVFEILEGCYEVRQNRDILSAICRYLIMCRLTDRKYFYWYALGVQKELHIARLYEFFMYSIDENSSEKLPQAIYLYFSHQNELNAAKKAFMYANLVRYSEEYPDIYNNIRDQIEHFVRGQLRAGRISPNLRTLYREFLPEWTLDKEAKSSLVDILYTYEISVNNPKIQQVTVLYHNMTKSMTVPLVGGSAQVRIYTKKDHVLLKDDKGDVYISTIPYEKIRMFPEERFLEWMKEEEIPFEGVIQNVCDTSRIADNTVKYFERMVRMENLRENARKELARDLLFYFHRMGDISKVTTYLADIDDALIDRSSRGQLMRIYMDLNQQKKAFDLIRKYGVNELDYDVVQACCSKYVRDDYYRENPLLLNACYTCFCANKYDEVMLGYLIDYYCGRTIDMKRIWRVAEQTEHNTHNLEERILIQMLFAEEVVGDEAVFYNYYIHGSNERVKKAYLNYKAYHYFVHNKIPDDRFFEYIETEFARDESINLSCMLAALKYYAGRSIEDQLIRDMLVTFLYDCRTEGYFFSYFQQYDQNILRKFSLNNRIVVQYCGGERSKVTLYYCIHQRSQKVNSFDEVIMPQTYHTYFMKELLLFTGEILDYYIVEEDEEASRVVEVGRIDQQDEFTEFTGRFSAINKIISEEYPDKLLDEYDRNNYMVTQMFKVM